MARSTVWATALGASLAVIRSVVLATIRPRFQRISYMDKRVFLTVLVCVGIMLVWQTFVMPPAKKAPKPPPASQQVAEQHKSEPASQQATTPLPAGAIAEAVEEKAIDVQT